LTIWVYGPILLIPVQLGAGFSIDYKWFCQFKGPNDIKNKEEVELEMKIRPLQDRVIVKRLEESETTKGGIIIPDSAKEQQAEGEVIAVGPGKKDDDGKITPLDVKVGEKVIFSKYGGTEVKIEGVEHLIMREDDILGVVEN
jgi:chaperonin GroES